MKFSCFRKMSQVFTKAGWSGSSGLVIIICNFKIDPKLYLLFVQALIQSDPGITKGIIMDFFYPTKLLDEINSEDLLR